MVFLKQGVGMEYIVLERLNIDAIESDQSISPQYIDTGGNDAISAWYIGSETTEVRRCLLQVSKMLCQELNGVLRPVLQK